jgi:immune inhibitor A
MKTRTIFIFGVTAFLLIFFLFTSPPSTTLQKGNVFVLDAYGMSHPKDDRPDPLTLKQRGLRKKALIAELHGKAYGHIHEVARGQFVELKREGEEAIWTVLGEFSDYPHNSIPEPDRAIDNTTIWRPDFNHDYYMDMLFAEDFGANSMRNYFIEQSSNRYAVYGDVTNWFAVPGTACDYDDGNPGPGGDTNVWQFLIDVLQAWYDAQIASGKSPEEIDAYLSQFDVWDRYDWDNDGNFNEPDGYIDRIQFVHSGEGNESIDGALGDCAIWSHSWYAYGDLIGIVGPSPDFLMGGVQIGESSFWVNKYTIMPENGGIGVFAHEFTHDLGLDDLYDGGGTPGVLENSTGYWTLMSAGNFLSEGIEDTGSKPGHMCVWEKFQLGWLNYEVAFAGRKSQHKLGPAETNTKQAQGLFVVLPDKEVTSVIAEPHSGSYFYYSGSGNDLDSVMYRSFHLPAGASLTAWVNYEIELDWDYAYLIISTDGGYTWTGVETNLSSSDDPNGANLYGCGITGDSGGWQELTADLSAWSDQDVLISFLYKTDSYVALKGFMVDDFAVTSFPLDDAESEAGWTFEGFRLTTGSESGSYFNAYVAEFRQYRGYDDSLRTGPYSFGFLHDPGLNKMVERFPYQDGLLISYWDSSQSNNDTSVHPGRGMILPIDAHPEVLYRPDGGMWVNRVQTFDSTFGLEDTDAIMLHWFGDSSYHPSLPAVPIFDDSNQYYRPINPYGGVINPNTGTQIRVKSISAQGGFMQVEVCPSH